MNGLLDNICHPSDLKNLTLEQLQTLAEEIRSQIINVLSNNGGHLSSNLGVVELTIALHRVFNSPQDQIIFDVSHQCYTHKLLTGRAHLFSQLRQYKGLCGFCHPQESPHDPFYAGHAGTALSLGLGVAKNRDLSHGSDYVIPIIGDASLTCGLTFEALNNVPKQLPHFITILNDNARSISENVGNIKNILSRFLNNPMSNKIYREIEELLSKVPACGNLLEKLGHKLTGSLKHFVSPAPFFEQFGFSYVGPVDGHDLPKLISTLEALKNNPHPILLHVMTLKGKGMPIAIEQPTQYHGVRPFDRTNGQFFPPTSDLSTFPQIFGQTLVNMAQKDPDLTVITPAMIAGSCLEEFQKCFPDRCFDVGIAEGHAATFAGALAMNRSKKVVACIYASFVQRALDNVFHDICLQDSPVILALDRAFLSGPDGSTHHGIYDIAFLNAMPHMIICQPRNGHLLKELFHSAVSWNRPCAIRYPNLETEEPNVPIAHRVVGAGEVLSEGSQVLLIALGHHYTTALKIRDILASHQIDATVVDPIFIKPLDTELFNRLLPTHHLVVTIEEHAVNSGFGMIFNSFLMQNKWKEIEVMNIGIPDTWVQFGSHQELLKELGLDAESIANRILQECTIEAKLC